MRGRGPARNVLLILTDQERQRRWMGDHALPARQRLLDEGVEFTRYYSNSTPCSPARASLLTGLYPSQHLVRGNVGYVGYSGRGDELDPKVRTIGHVLRQAGYHTAYLGKWHLSGSRTPSLEEYGFSDWSGDDLRMVGVARSGFEEDGAIADSAVDWMYERRPNSQPWFLVVSLINPHDIAYFPADQVGYQDAHREELVASREQLDWVDWRDDPIPPVSWNRKRRFSRLAPNATDMWHSKPEVHRQFALDWNEGRMGRIDSGDTDRWLEMLDYYFWLHEVVDVEIGRVLDALEDSGQQDTTITLFASDHGEMAGSHGLRGKGPFIYEENLNVPLYVRGPGIQAGVVTEALGSHVDLPATLLSLATNGALGTAGIRGSPGIDLSPAIFDATARPRDHVLFDIDLSWRPRTARTRYALRGIFDGQIKYARYFGIDDPVDPSDRDGPTVKRFGPDSPFEYQDHELYDLTSDPHELVNLAHIPEKASMLSDYYERLRAVEVEEITAP